MQMVQACVTQLYLASFGIYYNTGMQRNIACLPASCNLLDRGISLFSSGCSLFSPVHLAPAFLKAVASAPIFLHTVVMVRLCLNLLALFAIIIAAGLMWQDFVSEEPSVLLGQIWFEISPQSLQVSEAIIERYIDPCGLIPALGCSPFLWHPLIATILQWPAVLCFVVFAVGLNLLARLFPRGYRRRRNLNRDSF